jgi:hypothetical protein
MFFDLPHCWEVLMATQAVHSAIPVLNSWKEIAAYLGRGIRTVQRYEHEQQLPVRRVQGKHRGSIVALKSDLDVWLHVVGRAEPRGEAPDDKTSILISKVSKSASEMKMLRLEASYLRVAHRESVLRLRSSIKRLVEEAASVRAA